MLTYTPQQPTSTTTYPVFGWETRYPKKSARRKRHSGESGMQVPGLRYYSPGLGRWVNRDPIGEKGGTGLLTFADNSPVRKCDLLGLTAYGTFPVPPGVFPIHYLGRSGLPLYYPPGSDFTSRMRATPFAARFELDALTSVIDSIRYLVNRGCCAPKTFTRFRSETGYVLPWHDPDLFLAINRYTLSYHAQWTIDSNCCYRYKIKFNGSDVYDFHTAIKVLLWYTIVPWAGREFTIKWDWELSGGACP